MIPPVTFLGNCTDLCNLFAHFGGCAGVPSAMLISSPDMCTRITFKTMLQYSHLIFRRPITNGTSSILWYPTVFAHFGGCALRHTDFQPWYVYAHCRPDSAYRPVPWLIGDWHFPCWKINSFQFSQPVFQWYLVDGSGSCRRIPYSFSTVL